LAAYHSKSASLVVSNATLFAGRFIEGISSPALSTSPAPLQLRALCAGNATVTLTVPAAPVAQLVPLTGTTTAGCTVALSQLRATATLTTLPAPILLTLAAELSATGWLSGTISPYTPLSPESLAAKVEETLGPRLDNIEQQVGITLALAAVR
jgi:antitoxin (DNA-binding transcriptional repressor) of toxin-antitoxin stability system